SHARNVGRQADKRAAARAGRGDDRRSRRGGEGADRLFELQAGGARERRARNVSSAHRERHAHRGRRVRTQLRKQSWLTRAAKDGLNAMSRITDPRFDGIDCERSFLTGVIDDDESMSLEMDFCLTEGHPRYAAPEPGEDGCYRGGYIRFADI